MQSIIPTSVFLFKQRGALCALAMLLQFVLFTAKAQQNGDNIPPQDKSFILYNAFSHNDYWRDRPLYDALSYRFNCVEADLWLIDGELYVAHDRPQPDQSITFEKLYLKPLVEIYQSNKGKIYPESNRPFYLMIDCKTPGEAIYPILKKQLEPYSEMFCSVEEGEYKEGAILLFISGKRPIETVKEEKNRLVFLDGTIAELGKGIPSSLMPVVSDNFSAHINWRGQGDIPQEELQKMRNIISMAQAEGKLFRWWGAPDNEQFKRFFIKENVDLIGADELRILYDILTEEMK